MPERIEQIRPIDIVWKFNEAEFKRLLGITDPNGVLTVEVCFSTQTVSVVLSNRSA